MTYAGSQAQAGRGSVLSIGTAPGAAPPGYDVVGEIRTSGIGGAQWGTVDVSNFESGVDEEFITAMRNNGEVSLAGNRISSDLGQIACELAFSTGALYLFKLSLPPASGQLFTGDSYTFKAMVMSRDFAVDVSKEINWSVKLKISGPLTFAVGCSIVQSASNLAPSTNAAQGAGQSLVIPLPSPVTAGNMLIVFGFGYSRFSGNLATDTLGNAYTREYSDNEGQSELFLATSVAGGINAVTVTSSGNIGFGDGGSLASAIILEVSGLTAIDSGAGNAQSSNSADTGTFSTVAPNELILVSGYGSPPLTETSGRTLVTSYTDSTGNQRAIWGSVAAAAGSYSATVTSAGGVSATIFGFKTT